MKLAVTGAIAGVAFGYVLARSNLCFHSAWRGLFEHRFGLFKAWIVSVAVGVVGLGVIFSFGPWDGLNQGLPFRPAQNVVGGLIFGVGMVVAATCVSGMFYKLGSGMLGALVGLFFWALGEYIVVEWIEVPGPTVLSFGEGATLYGWIGVSRWVVIIPIAVALALAVAWTRRRTGGGVWWAWPVAGVALGVVLVLGWVLAGVGGASFGPSTVGAVSSIVAGDPNWWLISFLIALVPGAMVFAVMARTGWIRSEIALRYAQLAVGGVLLGAGARIAGGCNIGHAMSGLSQLSIASIVAVASMIAGVGLAWVVVRHVRSEPADWRPGPKPSAATT